MLHIVALATFRFRWHGHEDKSLTQRLCASTEMRGRWGCAALVCLFVLAATVLQVVRAETAGAPGPCFPTLGNSDIAHCKLPYTWEELASAYKQGQLDFVSGGFGDCSTDRLDVWLCIRPHPCSANIFDRFCFAYDEFTSKFLPLGKNTDVGYCKLEPEPPRRTDLQLACCDAAAMTLATIKEQIRSFNTSVGNY
jgi:hypothetical protein